MRLMWVLAFALTVALGLWIGLPRTNEAQGKESAGFLDASASVGASLSAAGAPTPSAPTIVAQPAPPLAVPPTTAPEKAVVTPVTSVRPAEAEIAALVLHRPWTEVSVRLEQAQLPEARKNMYRAFSAALAGDRERAQQFSKGLDKSDDLDIRERALLASALQGAPVAAVPAASGADSIGAVAMALALRARDADLALAKGQAPLAAAAYSEVLLADATAEWPSDRTALQRWTDGLTQAQAGHRWNAKGTWPSIQVTVKSGDSLTLIRQRTIKENPGMILCTGLIGRANQLRNERDLHPGDVLRIPTERVHMLVDISTRWVLYMIDDEVVAAWEGGVGKPGNDTIPGTYKIGLKQKNPTWFRPGAAPVPFGDPQNLLGTRWLSWQSGGVESHLGFHGTTDPNTVGGAVSSGCVRMRNSDVEVLFEILPEKSEVVVRP